MIVGTLISKTSMVSLVAQRDVRPVTNMHTPLVSKKSQGRLATAVVSVKTTATATSGNTMWKYEHCGVNNGAEREKCPPPCRKYRTGKRGPNRKTMLGITSPRRKAKKGAKGSKNTAVTLTKTYITMGGLEDTTTASSSSHGQKVKKGAKGSKNIAVTPTKTDKTKDQLEDTTTASSSVACTANTAKLSNVTNDVRGDPMNASLAHFDKATNFGSFVYVPDPAARATRTQNSSIPVVGASIISQKYDNLMNRVPISTTTPSECFHSAAQSLASIPNEGKI